MKTIILCGGRGRRLKEKTEYVPKPMLLIGDKPIVWHIMKIYASSGFNDFILALGYKSDYVKSFFLNQKAYLGDFSLNTKSYKATYYRNNNDDDFNITFVDTGLDTLVGERIKMCKKYIPKEDDNFMVTYGDGVTDINIKKLYNYHLKTDKIGTVCGVHPRTQYGLLKTNKNGLITEFTEKPLLRDRINGGFMVFKKEFFKYLKNGEMEHPALKRLVKKGQLTMYANNRFWYSVDTLRDYEEINRLWNTDKPPWKIW